MSTLVFYSTFLIIPLLRTTKTSAKSLPYERHVGGEWQYTKPFIRFNETKYKNMHQIMRGMYFVERERERERWTGKSESSPTCA